jgi:hypothetical protein
MITPDEPGSPRAAIAGEVSGSSGLGRPQRRIGGRERPHGMTREDGGEPKIVRQCCVGSLDRRCDVIAMATTVMMRIALVAIRRHLVSVARYMA